MRPQERMGWGGSGNPIWFPNWRHFGPGMFVRAQERLPGPGKDLEILLGFLIAGIWDLEFFVRALERFCACSLPGNCLNIWNSYLVS